MSSNRDNLIIITGASKGLGKAITELSIQSGAQVLGVARSSSLLETLAKELGSNFKYVVGDITNPSTIESIVSELNKLNYTSLTLINNAGTIGPIEKFDKVDMNSFKSAFDLNFFAVLSLTQACLPNLKKYNGKIINISSGAATHAYEGWSAYCCTKAAINAFTLTLTNDHPQIYAIAIRPGVVDTDMQVVIRDQGHSMGKDHQKFLDLHASQKLLPPSAPGKAIVNLALNGIPAELNGKFISWDDPQIQQS